jgi:hypothetical protein
MSNVYGAQESIPMNRFCPGWELIPGLLKRFTNTGSGSGDWRTANVTPIHKKGTKGDPGSYRPVSLTSIPCKIMESIVKDRMMEHLLENNLIKDSQQGFMPGRSCATNLVEFMDFVTKEVDDGHPVDIFFLFFLFY